MTDLTERIKLWKETAETLQAIQDNGGKVPDGFLLYTKEPDQTGKWHQSIFTGERNEMAEGYYYRLVPIAKPPEPLASGHQVDALQSELQRAFKEIGQLEGDVESLREKIASLVLDRDGQHGLNQSLILLTRDLKEQVLKLLKAACGGGEKDKLSRDDVPWMLGEFANWLASNQFLSAGALSCDPVGAFTASIRWNDIRHNFEKSESDS